MKLSSIHIYLLGQYTLIVVDRPLPPLPTEKSRGLLAYLVLHPLPQPRAHLAGLFWPDLPEKSARRRLTQELWRIGSELEKVGVEDLFTTTGSTVALSPHIALACDFHLLQDALTRLRQPDPQTWPDLAELIALYQGELLPGFYDDWVLLARERLFQEYRGGLERLLAAHKRMGDWSGAGLTVNALLQLDPLAEENVAEAMQIAHSLNRPEAGLRYFESYAARLRQELDVDPSPELGRLAQRLAAQTRSAGGQQVAAFTDPTYQPPLIGREGERALLLAAADRVQTGEGQLYLLEGPAGVGKSRLLYTLCADARWRGWLTGRGAAQEMQMSQPYQPLLGALGELLSPLRAQQLRVLLDPLWLAVAARVLPALAAWLPDLPPPPPLQPEAERVRLLESLTRLLLALGQLLPIVLVLDDLQWADSATLGLLIYLSRRVAEGPLLLLLAYRSEEARANPSVWVSLAEIDRSGRAHRLSLEGISQAETGELVRRILDLKQAAPLFEKRIYVQAQGNPFFVLETLRTLYQEGTLTPSEDGGWQTPWDDRTEDYQEIAVAPQIEAMIERRLAHLLPEERQILDVAAVLGATFDLDLLASLFTDAPLQALTAVSTLVQRRFLQETATAYRFEHDQIRQTVYARLDVAARGQLHRRAGETLARLQPDAFALLAHHFELAGAKGEAFRHHRRAGDVAQSTGSYLLARRHYERVVSWLDEMALTAADRFDLLLAWESLLDLLGERETQSQVLRRLAQEKGGDRRQQGVLALRQARFEGACGRFEAALDAAAAAFAGADHLHTEPLQVEALILWGELLAQVGDLAAAEAKLRQAVALAERVGEPRLQAQALIHLADVLPMRNAYAEARAAAEAALIRYHGLGDLAGEAHANLTLAIVSVEQGDVAGGAERYAQALALTEQCGYRFQEARIAANLANALCILGRIGEALALYERGMRIGRELGDARLEHLIAINYGSTYLSFVGPDEAVIRRVEEALAWSETVGDDIAVGQAWNLLCMAAYYGGDLPLARRHLDRSIAAFERVDYAYIKAQALRAQATLCQAEGGFEAALRLITQALAISREIGAPHLVTEMRSIQGEILLALGRADEALIATAEGVAGADPNVFQSYLLYHRHAQTLRAAGRADEAGALLAQAVDEFSALLGSLSPDQQARSRRAIPAHRALLADAELFL
ncbi:MAG: AAA family ATPase [Caldilineaceae bacterium]|nr:AAA family ATPase [Caldilineaceae bacterium]